MKINRLETHDRFIHLKKDQSINISQGAEDCLKKNPLSLGLQRFSPYIYIFAHPRTMEDGATKKMMWQPRLTRPYAQTNSYLFRALSNTDQMEVCWLLPPEELWTQYKRGNVTEHPYVLWSINQYLTNKSGLESPCQDDFKDDRAREIYKIVASEMDEETRMKKIYPILKE